MCLLSLFKPIFIVLYKLPKCAVFVIVAAVVLGGGEEHLREVEGVVSGMDYQEAMVARLLTAFSPVLFQTSL